ncbi:peptidylprolyl isomerase, FKBP-type [Shewanella sp. MR-4]|uniref:FKBP-type peptidyl-prolyl cis-trans isomerase n=1 Tax=Shewanella sp. (strain MR-4) TaxID=60480 RepID=UPI00005E5B97|nr:FKBP-type peptidyl-prolyl cis-trans isomerase [Shewanella sp. MR-4]ABI39875.1 peptidylprolyl isomerase, FKBP-type [Shewanella sp. MR-4]
MKMLLAVVVIAGVIFYFFTSMNNQKAAQENIRLGNEFLAQNKTQEGVKTTASGLQYQVLKQGTGTVHPKASDTVTVHYHGTLIDGTVFDSSVERGEPIAFPLNRVIPGWTEGVQLMVEGDKYRFFIPSELAYGNRSTGKIGGGSVLIFDVELLKVN